jgi:hypothetical protein
LDALPNKFGTGKVATGSQQRQRNIAVASMNRHNRRWHGIGGTTTIII